MLPLAASKDAALIQLMLVCASYEGRSRALFNDTAPRATGRSDGRDREVWMGMRCGRAPQIAIPPSRPATPRARTRLSASFASFTEGNTKKNGCAAARNGITARFAPPGQARNDDGGGAGRH